MGSINHVDTHTVACVAANPGLLTRRLPSRPSTTPFGTRTKASSPLEGNPDTASSMARNWCAILGCTFPINSTTPSLILEVAAHHWEQQCCSQPQACPLGDSQADSFRYLPDIPDLCFAHVEVSSPQKGHPNATAALLWTSMPHWGVHPLPSRVTTLQRCVAARRHCSLTAPSQTPSADLRVPPHPFSSIAAANRDHTQVV